MDTDYTIIYWVVGLLIGLIFTFHYLRAIFKVMTNTKYKEAELNLLMKIALKLGVDDKEVHEIRNTVRIASGLIPEKYKAPKEPAPVN